MNTVAYFYCQVWPCKKWPFCYKQFFHTVDRSIQNNMCFRNVLQTPHLFSRQKMSSHKPASWPANARQGTWCCAVAFLMRGWSSFIVWGPLQHTFVVVRPSLVFALPKLKVTFTLHSWHKEKSCGLCNYCASNEVCIVVELRVYFVTCTYSQKATGN